MKYSLTVQGGQYRIVSPDGRAFAERIKTLSDGAYTITLERLKRSRSSPQNNYYWAVIIPMIAHEIWESEDDTHEILKGELASKKTVIKKKRRQKTVYTPRSTADLTTIEFEQYCEKCRVFAREFLWVTVPLPDDGAPLPESPPWVR